MTAEKIKKAVAERLYEACGGDRPIYTEMVEQGFEVPCFFIEDKGSEIKPYLGRRYHYKGNVVIYAYGEACERRLFEKVEFIETDEGSLRGTIIEIKKEKEKMEMSIEYGAFFIKEKEEEPFMEVLIN